MTIFDYVVLAILLLSVALGAWRGLVGEALALVAWVIALMAAWLFGAQVGAALFAAIGEPALRTVAGAATVILLVLLVVALVKLTLRGLLKALGLSLTDRLLGVLFGLLRGVAIVFLLVAVGGLTSAPRQAWWKDARLAPPFETAVLMAKPMLPSDIGRRIRF